MPDMGIGETFAAIAASASEAMADVSFMDVIGAATQVAGMFTQSEGANQNAQAQNQMYQYQAQVAANNAAIANQNAQQAMNEGQVQAENQMMKGRAQAGATLAAQSASGLSVEGETAENVRKGQKIELYADEAQILNNAKTKANAFENQGKAQSAQSDIYKLAGANAIAAGDIASNSILLSGASSLADKWQKLQINQGVNAPQGGVQPKSNDPADEPWSEQPWTG